ncbi:MAG TPA: hypothetical protein VF797_20280, partial [Noviherbaspirillum sp.]
MEQSAAFLMLNGLPGLSLTVNPALVFQRFLSITMHSADRTAAACGLTIRLIRLPYVLVLTVHKPPAKNQGLYPAKAKNPSSTDACRDECVRLPSYASFLPRPIDPRYV